MHQGVSLFVGACQVGALGDEEVDEGRVACDDGKLQGAVILTVHQVEQPRFRLQ